MKRLLVLWIFLLGLPMVGHAETCTSTTAGTWTDASFNGPTWTGSPCTPEGSDTFIIDTAVTTDGTLTLTATTGITLNAGASWELDSSAAAFTLQLPAATPGFTQTAGSTVTFTPGFRSFGVTGAPIRALPTDANTVWRAGDVLLCPGWDNSLTTWFEDCEGALVDVSDIAGDADTIMLFYEDGKWDGAADYDSFVDESIEAIPDAASGEFIQFYRPGNRYEDMSHENSQFFEIVGQGETGGGHWIKLDILQTDFAAPRDGHYTLAFRAIHETTANAALPAGTPTTAGRTLQLASTTKILASNDFNGTWLYFSESTSPFGIRQQPLLVAKTTQGTPDTVLLADWQGAPWVIDSGEAIYMTHFGIRPGDPFLVIMPTKIVSASAALDDASWIQETTGSATIMGVVFSQIGQLVMRGAGADYTVKHMAIWDGGGDTDDDNGSVFQMESDVDSATVNYANCVGGRGDVGDAVDVHCFRFGVAAGDLAVRIADSSVRYQGDDAFVFGTLATGSALIERHQCAYSSGIGAPASASCVEISSAGLTSGRIVGVSGRGMNMDQGVIQCPSSSTTCTANGVMDIGGANSICLNETGCNLTNTTAIGTNPMRWQNQKMTNFTVRDTIAPANESAVLLTTRAGVQWKNGLFIDATGERDGAAAAWWDFNGVSTTSVFENIAIVDPISNNTSLTTDRGWDPGFTTGTPTITTRRIGWYFSDAWRTAHGDEFTNLWRAVATGVAWSGFVADGWLFAGHIGNGTGGYAVVSTATAGDWQVQADISNGPCFWSNNRANGTNADNFTDPFTGSIRSLDIGLRYYSDPTAYATRDFSPIPGGLADVTGCGVRGGKGSPGVHTKGWEHYINGLEPDYMGATIGGGGGGATHGPVPF